MSAVASVVASRLDGDGEVGGGPHRAAVQRAGDHLVQRLVARPEGGGEDAARDAQLERDRAVQRQHDHAVNAHGQILSHDDILATYGEVTPCRRLEPQRITGGRDMSTMRAIGQDTLGGPEVLKLIEVDRPEPGLLEILVRVRAAGVNPTDWKGRATGGLAGGAAADPRATTCPASSRRSAPA